MKGSAYGYETPLDAARKFVKTINDEGTRPPIALSPEMSRDFELLYKPARELSERDFRLENGEDGRASMTKYDQQGQPVVRVVVIKNEVGRWLIEGTSICMTEMVTDLKRYEDFNARIAAILVEPSISASLP